MISGTKKIRKDFVESKKEVLQNTETMLNLNRELQQVLQERNRMDMCNRRFYDGGLSNKDDREKRRTLRLKAVDEIIASEKSYLRQLEILMYYFVNPIKLKKILDVHSHSLLFGQIEMIYNLNGELLRELDDNKDNVAQAFIKMAPFLKVYSVYAFGFRNAMLMLQEIENKNTEFRKFMVQTETRPEVQLTLNSLMIVPIQRLPRYKLLLEQVLLYTSPSEIDFKLLKDSVTQITSIVSHVNSCVEEQEVTLMLLNLQNSLSNRSPNIVKPSRKIVKEGRLFKISRNGSQLKRFCVLMSDIFMYCKILKDREINTAVENALECCCIFPLKKCKIYELFPDSFKITCQGDAIIFSSSDLQLVRSWINCIRGTINLHIQCRKTLRKESSKRKPTRKKNMKYFENDCQKRELPEHNKRKSCQDVGDKAIGCFPFKKNCYQTNINTESDLKHKRTVKALSDTRSFTTELSTEQEQDYILQPSPHKRVKFDFKENNASYTNEQNATKNVDTEVSLTDKIYNFFSNIF
ncbi:myosin-M heavy chain [Zeugodacus cucurbitae]|uniref:Myosin-M heavy chain n=1 Tax=Zeugodacus cucurbitae TaxID=28588 RepID=A0A0A1WVP0_ZEUCU|nr:myosin-M heavy chain [Zeugodacus cucurbitae]